VAEWRPDGEPRERISHGYAGMGLRR
jgi:hypothetical protein